MADLMNILAALLALVATIILVFALSGYWRERRDRSRLKRLVYPRQRAKASAATRSDGVPRNKRLDAIMASLSRLSLPEGADHGDRLRLRFMRAGLRDKRDLRNYYAITTTLTLGLPFVVGLVVVLLMPGIKKQIWLMASVTCAACGYYGPKLWLQSRIANRAADIRNALPDLIDLLVICSKAGLAFDQALARITREISRTSQALGEEFHLVSLEIRAGVQRATALRNLTKRVELDELQGFVSMLVQADRFGTSISDALVIQGELLRVRRMQRAEEIAAKIPTKMLLPLVFMIFPALMFVLLGPATIQLLTVLGK